MKSELEQLLHELSPEKQPTNPHEAEDRELEEAGSQIWEIAKELRMDPFPIHFEVVPPQVMYEIGTQYLPERFSHWTHGRAYRQMKTMYDYGLTKIYELIINSDPAQAFLLENNPPLENKFVTAHVMGHSDFFKNNYLFQQTKRDMPESAARNADRIRGYEDRYGRDAVEGTLDAVLAIDDHIDPFKPASRDSRNEELEQWREGTDRKKKPEVSLSKFADIFDLGNNGEALPENSVVLRIPPTPDKDLLGFIRNHAPYLEEWERDIVDIVRNESLYFYPQKRTKIMNEGWASLGHKLILREMGYRDQLSPSENERWWELHSSVLQPNPRQLNPYYFGMKMFEYWLDYYNGTLSEKENKWLEQQGMPQYPKFEGRYEGDVLGSPGMEKLREIMTANDDQSFIRNHFDKNIAERMNMYIYEKEEDNQGGYFVFVKEKGWEQIRDTLADSMVNCGDPYIVVRDGDYQKRRELYLEHQYDGQELDQIYLTKTLPYVHQLWRRPVHLETVVNGKAKRFTYDGQTVLAADL